MLVVKGGGSCASALSWCGLAQLSILILCIYILWLTELGAISRCLALVRTGSIILRKKFIYLFILVAFVCLSGSWRWPCFRLVSFDLVLEFKFSSFILNERSDLF